MPGPVRQAETPGSPLATLLLTAALAVAAIPALGAPDLASVADFLTSTIPNRQGALAAVQVVVWGMVLALLVAQVAYAVRRSGGFAVQARRRRRHAWATLGMGILIFAGGMANHQSRVGSVCCGDLSRADHLLP